MGDVAKSELILMNVGKEKNNPFKDPHSFVSSTSPVFGLICS